MGEEVLDFIRYLLIKAERLIQFFLLGDPPLEELVVTRAFLITQGIPSLVAAIFFLLGAFRPNPVLAPGLQHSAWIRPACHRICALARRRG
jgi:hypothetical protein